MANIRVSVAAATAVVGYDLVQSDINNRQPMGRRLTNLALTGSAAAGDCIVELMINGRAIGRFANTSTGLVADRTKDFRAVNAYVRANELIQVFVRDAADTNPIVLEMEFTESSGTGRRSYGRRSYTGGRRTTSGAYRGRRSSSGMY